MTPSEETKPTISFFLKQRRIVTNLVLMSIIWLTSSFGYYLIATLNNMFPNPIETTMTSAFAEMMAYLVSGLVYERIGVKLSLILSFGISTIGGIIILAWGL